MLDSDSGLLSLNKFASGSGSISGRDSSYDRITRQTGFIAIEKVVKQQTESNPMKDPVPFVFISAAEAGWKFRAPVNFLERYLQAKRSVENKLLSSGQFIRPII